MVILLSFWQFPIPLLLLFLFFRVKSSLAKDFHLLIITLKFFSHVHEHVNLFVINPTTHHLYLLTSNHHNSPPHHRPTSNSPPPIQPLHLVPSHHPSPLLHPCKLSHTPCSFFFSILNLFQNLKTERKKKREKNSSFQRKQKPNIMSMYPQRTQHQQRLTELLDAIKSEFDYALNEASSFKRSKKTMTPSTSNKLLKCNKSVKLFTNWKWHTEKSKKHTKRKF